MIDEGYKYYKIKLKHLTQEQIQRIIELDGVRRFLFNFGLNYCEELKEQGKPFPSFKTLCSLLTTMRHSEEYTWLTKYNVTTERYALKDLVHAYDMFFKKINRHPKFKTKKRHRVSCQIRSDRFSFKENGDYAYIPGISGSRKDLIYLGTHNIPHHKNICFDNIRIKSDGIDYWLSLSVRVKNPIYIPPMHNNLLCGDGIGIDIGIRTTAALSDGTMYYPPDKRYIGILDNRLKRIASLCGIDNKKRLAQSIRTKTKYEDIPKSKNQIKRENKYRQLYRRITNIIRTHSHRVSRDIANRQPRFIILETLNLTDLKHQHKYISPYIHKASLYQLSTYIEYKCRDIGSIVIRAPIGYKSTQICNNCGAENKIGPSKIYTCSCCGMSIDRDLNAALNLRDYGYQVIGSV